MVQTKGGFFPTGYFKIVDKNSQLAIDTIFLNCLYLIQMIMIFNIIKMINEFVKKTSAYKNNKIVYLDADSWLPKRRRFKIAEKYGKRGRSSPLIKKRQAP